jgi:hypothetical protein
VRANVSFPPIPATSSTELPSDAGRWSDQPLSGRFMLPMKWSGDVTEGTLT